jgi:hypothetical protein
MEMISIEGKTNFFEKRVGEYALQLKTKMKQLLILMILIFNFIINGLFNSKD